MKITPPKILFFVDGVSPSPEDMEEAAKLSGSVVFRNARAVPAEGALENCDGVAGCVPPRYEEAYDDAETAIEKHAAKIKALAEKVGDEPAPQKPAKAGKGAKGGEGQGNNASGASGAPAPAGGGSAPAWKPNS